MEGKAPPSGPPRTFSVRLGRVEVMLQGGIMEGQGDPFRAASHLLGQAGTGRRHDHGIIFMRPTHVSSLKPMGQGTTVAEPPWGQGLAGGHLGEVPDHVPCTLLLVPGKFCFMNLVQKCPHGPPEVPLGQARDPGHGARGPKISLWLSLYMLTPPA